MNTEKKLNCNRKPKDDHLLVLSLCQRAWMRHRNLILRHEELPTVQNSIRNYLMDIVFVLHSFVLQSPVKTQESTSHGE